MVSGMRSGDLVAKRTMVTASTKMLKRLWLIQREELQQQAAVQHREHFVMLIRAAPTWPKYEQIITYVRMAGNVVGGIDVCRLL